MTVSFIIRSDKPITDKDERKAIAEIVSGTIEAGRYKDCFVPYMPMDHDSFFWTVDTGNDWKVKFSEENLTDFEIFHRYNNNEVVKGLSTWIAFRLGHKIVEKIS